MIHFRTLCWIVASAIVISACAGDQHAHDGDLADSSAAAANADSLASGLVHDHAGMMSAAVRAELTTRLQQIEDSSTVQIAIVTIDSLGQSTIEQSAARIFDEMKIGRREFNSGILILVAESDKRARIEVGTGAEWQVPDSLATIVLNEMFESFRGDDFDTGLRNAVARLQALLTAVPWVVRYRSLADVDSSRGKANGEILQLKGTLSKLDTQSATLRVDSNDVFLLLPPHWNGLPQQPTEGQTVTMTGRIASTEPITVHVLSMD